MLGGGFTGKAPAEHGSALQGLLHPAEHGAALQIFR